MCAEKFRKYFAAFFFGGALVVGGFAAVDAEKLFQTALSVRNGHRLVYDSSRKKAIMFGGANASTVLGDLWEWDGRKWHFVNSTPSLARTFPAIAYDNGRKKIIVFGGNRVLFGSGEENTFLDDTWEWDGKTWSKLEIKGPSERAEAVMVYDSARKRTILFGGYVRKDGKTYRLGDTWEFDGQSWIQVSTTGPSPRSGSAMVYDNNREKSILFGGNGLLNDTWEWNGKSWNKIGTKEVPGRFNCVMAYDPVDKSIIRFGGWNGSARVGDTWLFDGANWEQLNIVGPKPRNHSAMVYDSARRRIVLFGGHDGEIVFGDTWEWNGKSWIQAVTNGGEKRVENGH